MEIGHVLAVMFVLIATFAAAALIAIWWPRTQPRNTQIIVCDAPACGRTLDVPSDIFHNPMTVTGHRVFRRAGWTVVLRPHRNGHQVLTYCPLHLPAVTS